MSRYIAALLSLTLTLVSQAHLAGSLLGLDDSDTEVISSEYVIPNRSELTFADDELIGDEPTDGELENADVGQNESDETQYLEEEYPEEEPGDDEELDESDGIGHVERLGTLRTGAGGTKFLINDAQFRPDADLTDGICDVNPANTTGTPTAGQVGFLNPDGVSVTYRTVEPASQLPVCNLRAALETVNYLGGFDTGGNAVPPAPTAQAASPGPYSITVEQNWIQTTNMVTSYAGNSSTTANPKITTFQVSKNTAPVDLHNPDGSTSIGAIANNIQILLGNAGAYCNGINSATCTGTNSNNFVDAPNRMYTSKVWTTTNQESNSIGAYFWVKTPVTIDLGYQMSFNTGSYNNSNNNPGSPAIFYLDGPGITLSGLKDVYSYRSAIVVSAGASNIIIQNGDVTAIPYVTTSAPATGVPGKKLLTINGLASGTGTTPGPDQVVFQNFYVTGYEATRLANATTAQTSGVVVYNDGGAAYLNINNVYFDGVVPFSSHVQPSFTSSNFQHVNNIDFTNNTVANLAGFLGNGTGSTSYTAAVMQFGNTVIDGTVNFAGNTISTAISTSAPALINFQNPGVLSCSMVGSTTVISSGTTCVGSATGVTGTGTGSLSASGVLNVTSNNYLGCTGATPSCDAGVAFISPGLNNAGTIVVDNNTANLNSTGPNNTIPGPSIATAGVAALNSGLFVGAPPMVPASPTDPKPVLTVTNNQVTMNNGGNFVAGPASAQYGAYNIGTGLLGATVDTANPVAPPNLPLVTISGNNVTQANGGFFGGYSAVNADVLISGNTSNLAGNSLVGGFFANVPITSGSLTVVGNNVTSSATSANFGYFVVGTGWQYRSGDPLNTTQINPALASSAVITLDQNVVNMPGALLIHGCYNSGNQGVAQYLTIPQSPTAAPYAAQLGAVTVTNNTVISGYATTGSAGAITLCGAINAPITVDTNTFSIIPLLAMSTGATQGVFVLNSAQPATAPIAFTNNTVTQSTSVATVLGANNGGFTFTGNTATATSTGATGSALGVIVNLPNAAGTGPVLIANNPAITAITTSTINTPAMVSTQAFNLNGAVPALTSGDPGFWITNNTINNTNTSQTTATANSQIGETLVIPAVLSAAGSAISIDHNNFTNTFNGNNVSSGVGAIINLSGAQSGTDSSISISNNNIQNSYTNAATAVGATAAGAGSPIIISGALSAGNVSIDHNNITSNAPGGAIVASGSQSAGTQFIIDKNVIQSAGSIISFGTGYIDKAGVFTVTNNAVTATGTVPNHRFHFSAGRSLPGSRLDFINNSVNNTSDALVHAIVALPRGDQDASLGIQGLVNVKYNTFTNLNGSIATYNGHWIFFPGSAAITQGTGNQARDITGAVYVTNNYVQYQGTSAHAIAWTSVTNTNLNTSQNFYVQNNYFDWNSTAIYGVIQFANTKISNVSGNVFSVNTRANTNTVTEETVGNSLGLYVHNTWANAVGMATWFPTARTNSPTNTQATIIKTISGQAAKLTDIVAVPVPMGPIPNGAVPASDPIPNTPLTVADQPLPDGSCVIELEVAPPTASNGRWPGQGTANSTSLPNVTASSPIYVDVYWSSGTPLNGTFTATSTPPLGSAGNGNAAELFLGRFPVYASATTNRLTLAVELPQDDDPRLVPKFGAGELAADSTDGTDALVVAVPQSQTIAATDADTMSLIGTMSPVDGHTYVEGELLPIGQVTPIPNGQSAPTNGPIDSVTGVVSGALRLQTIDPTAPILAGSQYSRAAQISGLCAPIMILAQADGHYPYRQFGYDDPAVANLPLLQTDATMLRDLHYTLTSPKPLSTETVATLKTDPASIFTTQVTSTSGATVTEISVHPLITGTTPNCVSVNPGDCNEYSQTVFDVVVRLSDSGTVTLGVPVGVVQAVNGQWNAYAANYQISPAPDATITYINPLTITGLSSAASDAAGNVIPNDVLITGSPDGQQYALAFNTQPGGATSPIVPFCPVPAVAATSLCVPIPTYDVIAAPVASPAASLSFPGLNYSTTGGAVVSGPVIPAGQQSGNPVVVTAQGISVPPGTQVTLSHTVTSLDSNYHNLPIPNLPPIPLYSTQPAIELNVTAYKVDDEWAENQASYTIADVLANAIGGPIVSGSILSVNDWICIIGQIANTSSTDLWNTSINSLQISPQYTWPNIPSNSFPFTTLNPLGFTASLPSPFASTTLLSPLTPIPEIALGGSTTVRTEANLLDAQPYLWCTQLLSNSSVAPAVLPAMGRGGVPDE